MYFEVTDHVFEVRNHEFEVTTYVSRGDESCI